ncbi:MAG: beta-lactamase family protein [Chitinophagales bacterium]|nr:beta-lactamase family protein [Chitinophagales bacterium]
MKQLLLLAFLAIFMPFTGKGQLAPQLDSLLNDYYKKKEFNGVVLVAKKGKNLFQQAYGHASIEERIPNEIETKFLIGSTTKSFTAIAIMQLWESGLVNMHTPIKKYIPELNDEIGRLTLHLLMKNASGLPVHLNRITKLEYRDISSKELIELYNESSLSFEPGSKFEYSNLNYQLCALVLERVTGQSFKKYIEERILTPLEMFDSGIERTRIIARDKAVGYDLENGKFTEAPQNYMAYALGGGDMYSTAIDLLKWDQALYGEKLLGLEAKQLLFDGKPGAFGGYGYGFKVKEYNRSSTSDSGKLVRHGGSMYGYISNVHRYLDDQVVIIVLGNIRPYPAMKITLEIETLLFKEKFL